MSPINKTLPVKKIDANQFIKTWKLFSVDFCKKNKEWRTEYDSNTKWSELFLAGTSSTSVGSPIGDFFEYNLKGLRYRREDALYDLTFSFDKNFTDIPYISKGKIELWNIEEIKYYPVSYDIVLEVEN